MLDNSYIQVSEIMTTRPVCMQKGKTVAQAARRMAAYRVGTLLILSGKKLIGIISVNDIVYSIVAKNKDPTGVFVDDLMQTKFQTITPDKDVKDAMELMTEYELKILPVLEQGSLAGYLTMKDILRIEPTLFDLAVDNIRAEEENRQKTIEQLGDVSVVDEIDDDLN